MAGTLSEFRRKKRHRFLTAISIAGLLLFFLAAMMRIGVGEAEWAGMTVSKLTPNLAMEFDISGVEEGVVINWVEGPGYYSGLREGDLLRAINNKKVRNVKEFLRVAENVNLSEGVLLDVLRDGHPIYITLYNRLGLHGKLKEALNIGGAGITKTRNSNPPMTNVAFPRTLTGARLPTPKEQKASGKILIEGHWLGMELIPLTPELAKKYRIPPGTKGLLVDEITLEAAESGILAGDMVVAVAGVSTPDLVAFTEATRRVKNKRSANILVSRRGQLIKFAISSWRALGFSQNEAAQPILPGAISPHRNRNKPCTACHIIMRSGGQLPTDAGDILPNAPPITRGAKAHHEYRGKCKNCHVILK